MRTRSVVIVLAAVLAAAGAEAGTLASATWTQEIEGIALTVTNSGATCTDPNPARVPGAGFITCPTAGLQATGASTGTAYSVSLTMPLFAFQVFTTGGAINLATRASLSGAQQIDGNAFSATGTPGIAGMVTRGGAQHTLGSMWNQPAMGTLAYMPLSIGRTGRLIGTFSVLLSPYVFTVDFYAWTPGTLTFTGLTLFDEPLPDVVAMGSFALTANGAGTVTLVAPAKLSIDGPAAQRRTVALASLKLTFVPEPSTLLLLGAGVLALLGFRRRS